jgi:hypothetical protein
VLEHCWLEILIFQLLWKRQLSKINAEQDAQNGFCSENKKQNVKVGSKGIADYQRIISTTDDKQFTKLWNKAKELAASDNTKIIFMNGKTIAQ